MNDVTKFLVVMELNANASPIIDSLEEHGYEVISDDIINKIQTFHVKKKNKPPINQTLRKQFKKANKIKIKSNSALSIHEKFSDYSAFKNNFLATLSKQNNASISIENTNSNPPFQADKEIYLVQKACNYLIKEISKKHTLESLSRELLTNRNTLAKAFKNTLGQGVFCWLRQQRVIKAKSFLKDTEQSIQSISFEVGYNDPANFSTAFKKITGYSPKQYRDKLLNKKVLVMMDL